MNINDLIAIIKKKLQNNIVIENIIVEDKSFLHKNHKENVKGKYYIKLLITSKELKTLNRIQSNKKIYKILEKELKSDIHSIQILIS